MKRFGMRYVSGLFAVLGLILGGAAAASAQDAAAKELVKQVMDALPKVPFEAKLRLTSPGSVRELTLSHKLVGGARASYLEVTAPEDLKGIRFLFLEHLDKPSEQYIKVTASRRAVLVADEVRKQPFLGSAFYVADLIEPPLNAFNYKFAGEEKVLDRQCKLVESTPLKPADALYSKTINSLDPKDLLALRREFFDTKGRLLKVWEVKKVDKQDGNWTILDQSMTNVQEQTTSRLETLSVNFNVVLSDAMFTPNYLLKD
jgi:outer membrane lipoprotein-sorting protein